MKNKRVKEDFKIHFDQHSKRIYVHEKNGVVVCTISGFVTVPSCGFMRPFCITAKGVARCLPDDEFNAELGAKIAAAKAENNAYAQAIKIIEDKAFDAANFIHSVSRFGNKACDVIKHNHEYIDRISNF